MQKSKRQNLKLEYFFFTLLTASHTHITQCASQSKCNLTKLSTNQLSIPKTSTTDTLSKKICHQHFLAAVFCFVVVETYL